MKRKVSFHQLAEFELNDTAIFLANERQGLGLRFLDAMEAGVAHIRDYPEASRIVIENIRCKVLRRFPYSIMFSIRQN